jgi:hypothetical protein
MMKIVIGLAGLAAIGSTRTCAQAEVDPDHFDTTNTEPLTQPQTHINAQQTAKLNYGGNFTLPYHLQCNGRNLLPGKYFLALNSDGRTARLTLNRKGQVVRIDGIKQNQNRDQKRNGLIVERSGKLHRLSVIHVAQLDLVLNPAQGREGLADGGSKSIERLPVILNGSRKCRPNFTPSTRRARMRLDVGLTSLIRGEMDLLGLRQPCRTG